MSLAGEHLQILTFHDADGNSVTGVLRALRLSIDADFQQSRVRIAPIDAGPS